MASKSKKIDNSKIIDSYLLDDDRKDKVKSLMDGLPKDSFIDLKKDKNILIPFHPGARDHVQTVLDVLLKDYSEQELATCLMKVNTDPDTWEKEKITFTKDEWAVYFTLDLYHSIGYYAIDQDSVEIIKDPKLFSDVSKIIDENAEALKAEEQPKEVIIKPEIPNED